MVARRRAPPQPGGILTFGALGTNHGLATARYATANGLRAVVAVVDQPVDEHVAANYARLRQAATRVYRTRTPARTAVALAWILPRNGMPYVLPAGGSSPVGALGYVEAAFEIAEQVRSGALTEPGTIVCAVGTGGTLAGLLGLRLAAARRAGGGCGGERRYRWTARTVRLCARTAGILRRRGAVVPRGAVPLEREVILTRDALGPGYGHPTDEAEQAAEQGRAWGLELDPVYTAKAFGHLLCHHAAGGYGDRPVLFLDTNGPRPSARTVPDASQHARLSAPRPGSTRRSWRSTSTPSTPTRWTSRAAPGPRPSGWRASRCACRSCCGACWPAPASPGSWPSRSRRRCTSPAPA